MTTGVVGRQPCTIEYGYLPYHNLFLQMKGHSIHRELIPLLVRWSFCKVDSCF